MPQTKDSMRMVEQVQADSDGINSHKLSKVQEVQQQQQQLRHWTQASNSSLTHSKSSDSAGGLNNMTPIKTDRIAFTRTMERIAWETRRTVI